VAAGCRRRRHGGVHALQPFAARDHASGTPDARKNGRSAGSRGANSKDSRRDKTRGTAFPGGFIQYSRIQYSRIQDKRIIQDSRIQNSPGAGVAHGARRVSLGSGQRGWKDHIHRHAETERNPGNLGGRTSAGPDGQRRRSDHFAEREDSGIDRSGTTGA